MNDQWTPGFWNSIIHEHGQPRFLTLWEPWATLMALGYKEIETRSWGTPYRGIVFIHAAKKNDAEVHSYIDDLHPFLDQVGASVSFGKVVGCCVIKDCRPTKYVNLNNLSATEKRLGDYSPGRYAWITDFMVRLPHPVEMQGGQGLRRVTDARVLEAVKKQVVSL